jgi:hypothetical protein
LEVTETTGIIPPKVSVPQTHTHTDRERGGEKIEREREEREREREEREREREEREREETEREKRERERNAIYSNISHFSGLFQSR